MGYRQSRERKRRLKRMYENRNNSGVSGVWFDEDRNRYIRVYRPSSSKWLKKQCNRRVRRTALEPIKNGQYKKIMDYWYILY